MTTCFGLIFVMWCDAAAPTPAAAAPYCQIARPVAWSSRDTRETKAAVDAENRKWKRLCGRAVAR